MIDREVAMSVILSCWFWEDHITSLPLEEPPASQKNRGGVTLRLFLVSDLKWKIKNVDGERRLIYNIDGLEETKLKETRNV